jgi:hypothetical protein
MAVPSQVTSSKCFAVELDCQTRQFRNIPAVKNAH